MFQKSIYRLKQASQSWNIHFDEVVKGFGFIKNDRTGPKNNQILA